MDISDEDLEVGPGDYLLSHKNPGFAVDLGAQYKYDKHWMFSASVLDLGIITMNENPQTFKFSGEAPWTGIDITRTLQENGSQEQIGEMVDSVYEKLNADITHDKYSYWLDPKIYLAGKYQYNENWHFGAVSRNEIFMKRFISSLTLTAIYRPTHWFHTLLSYSIMNNNFSNMGFGFKIGPFYATTDNIIGLIWSGHMANKVAPLMNGEAGEVWTSNTQTANFRFGFYIPIGCKPDPSKAMFY
jgi:hypothetical protein